MRDGVPPTIGGIPSLQICHKFEMFQRISFQKQCSGLLNVGLRLVAKAWAAFNAAEACIVICS